MEPINKNELFTEEISEAQMQVELQLSKSQLLHRLYWRGWVSRDGNANASSHRPGGEIHVLFSEFLEAERRCGLFLSLRHSGDVLACL